MSSETPEAAVAAPPKKAARKPAEQTPKVREDGGREVPTLFANIGRVDY